jgi:hypothetical protein
MAFIALSSDRSNGLRSRKAADTIKGSWVVMLAAVARRRRGEGGKWQTQPRTRLTVFAFFGDRFGESCRAIIFIPRMEEH